MHYACNMYLSVQTLAMAKYKSQLNEWYLAIMSSFGKYIFNNCIHVILSYTTLKYAILIKLHHKCRLKYVIAMSQ